MFSIDGNSPMRLYPDSQGNGMDKQGYVCILPARPALVKCETAKIENRGVPNTVELIAPP